MNCMKIERGAIYMGTRAICEALKCSRNTMHEYIKQGLRIRRRRDGTLVLSGDDVMDWYASLPVVKREG
jgi:predicted site-specific integrase-resolvase